MMTQNNLICWKMKKMSWAVNMMNWMNLDENSSRNWVWNKRSWKNSVLNMKNLKNWTLRRN
jgi:hypothetical protein